MRIRLVNSGSLSYNETMKNTDTKNQESIEYYKERNEKLMERKRLELIKMAQANLDILADVLPSPAKI